jgi:hypothetical protein
MSYIGYVVMIAAPRNSVRMSPLLRWPLLRAMQDAKYSHLILRFKDFVDSDVWERRKSYLACAIDAPRASDTRKGSQLADALDH